MACLRPALLLALVAGTGCGTTAPTEVQLTGCWSAPSSVPGSGWSLQLSEVGTALSGTGHFFIEAGPSGSIAVTGERSGASFSLVLTYETGLVRQVEATIRGPNRFDALISDVPWHTISGPVTFLRCTP